MIFSWFSKNPAEELKPVPEISKGEHWQLCIDRDPFGPKEYRPVEILDVREGWVRYDMGPGSFRDERKPVEDFVRMYKKVEK